MSRPLYKGLCASAVITGCLLLAPQPTTNAAPQKIVLARDQPTKANAPPIIEAAVPAPQPQEAGPGQQIPPTPQASKSPQERRGGWSRVQALGEKPATVL